jgi:hypothetical protein
VILARRWHGGDGERAAEAAPSISTHGLVSTFETKELAREGLYILPILRCPLLADADMRYVEHVPPDTTAAIFWFEEP